MKKKVLIVYASFTGNTEESANYLHRILKTLGTASTLKECTQVNAEEFLDYDICIVGTYTWGRAAELPDEIYDLYDGLEKLDLKGKIYGVFGTGDKLYDKYCQSVDDFDIRFSERGAIKAAESVKIEDEPEEEDFMALENFARQLLAYK